MGRLVPDLATASDDDALRGLLASNPVPGTMTVSYRCEPSYFAAADLLGPFHQTVVGRDECDGSLGAMVCRSVRERWVGGRALPVGYLSNLRVDSPHRGRWVVGRGLRHVRGLDRDGRAPEGYLATIVEGSRQAAGMLVERPREGSPEFVPVATLLTMALVTRRSSRRPAVRSGLVIGPALTTELDEVASFLARRGPSRRFFPVVSAGDLAGHTSQGAGLGEGDVFVARRGGEIVATAALWDQSGVRQAVVCGYGGPLERARRVIGVAARVAGASPLPDPGQRIPMAYASLLTVAEDDPAVARSLLRVIEHAAAERGIGFLMLGMTERDPLLPAVARWPRVTYRSTVYALGWDGAAHRLAALGASDVAHVEIALL
jgi:hypothetical protein